MAKQNYEEAANQAPVTPEKPEVVTAEHPYTRHLFRNETLFGLNSDVHQALVTVSNLHKDRALAHAEVAKALQDFDGPDEVRAVLQSHLDELQNSADLYHKVHDIMFNYTR